MADDRYALHHEISRFFDFRHFGFLKLKLLTAKCFGDRSYCCRDIAIFCPQACVCMSVYEHISETLVHISVHFKNSRWRTTDMLCILLFFLNCINHQFIFLFMFPVAVTFLILVRRHYDKLRTSGFADHVLLLVMAMHTQRAKCVGSK